MNECLRERRKAVILRIARRRVAVNGFAATTIDELVEEAGFSKPTFYEHFSSKEALGECLLRHSLHEAGAKLRELESALPAAVALRSLIEWAIEQHFASGQNAFARLSVEIETPALVADKSRWIDALEGLVARAQHMGAMSGSTSPQIIAGTLHGILSNAGFVRALANGTLTLTALKCGVSELLLA